jgi:tetratricopeptide (TPR) repeat protein
MVWRAFVLAAAISLAVVPAALSQSASDQSAPSQTANPDSDAQDRQVLDQLDKAVGGATGRDKDQMLGLRAVLQNQMGNPGGAVSKLDQDAEHTPDGALARLRDALTYYDSGDLVSASTEVDEALKRNPKLEAALLMRATIDSDMNNGKALDDFARLAELAGKSSLGRWSAAVAAFGKKDFAEAVRQSDASIEADPDFVFAYMIRGAAYGAEHNGVESARDFEHAVKLAPIVPGAYIGLCIARIGNHDRQQAIAACDTAVSLAPDFSPVHAMRAYAHLDIGDYPTAIAEMDQTIASTPDDPKSYLMRGAIRGRMGDNRGEIDDLNHVLATQPDNADAYGMRCDAYYSMNLFAQAMSDCNRALVLKPGLYGALTQRSLVESALNDFGAAAADAKAAIAADPLNAFAYIDLGKIYADHGDEDLAGTTLDKASELDPGDGDIYVTRASVDLFQHDFAKTLSDARTAARLGLGSALMSALEGYSAIALGRNADAVVAFRRRLAAQPGSPYAVIWLALAELKTGVAPDDVLRPKLEQMSSMRWPGIVAQMFLGKSDVDAVNAFAMGNTPGAHTGLACEAGFYTGEKLLLDNKREAAAAAFRSAVELCPRPSPSGAVSAAELANLHR